MLYRELIEFNKEQPLPGDNGGAEGDAGDVIAAVWTRKSPGQRRLVEEHLSRFAQAHGNMRERMARFVDLFPIHPDLVRLFPEIGIADTPQICKILAALLGTVLDEPVPEDSPGFIACDSLWEILKSQRDLWPCADMEAVIRCEAELEVVLLKSQLPPDVTRLALKAARGLAVYRLCNQDIYSRQGPTESELRDTLCLLQTSADDAAGRALPQDRTPAILHALRNACGKRMIGFDSASGQWFLHVHRLRRFEMAEVVLHWVNAVPFLMLMLTGAAMFGSRFVNLEHKWFAAIRAVHYCFAAIWAAGVPIIVLSKWKIHWGHIRVMLHWGVEDLLWMVQSFRAVYNKKAVVGAAGRFNTGQKINASLVIMYFFAFTATGITMLLKGSVLAPWFVHTALFFSAMGSVGGHLFLALINKSTRISLPGIFHGWAPREYIEHHHPLSMPSPPKEHVHSVTPQAVFRDVISSKLEILVLVCAVLLAVVGAFAFDRAQAATIEKTFVKGFAAGISPSQLTTKHRIGPTADSCIKCHSITGSIPAVNCEQCHAEIKSRRETQFGYHGTLKGECVSCHKEHPRLTNSLVPSVRGTFNHELADFKLKGKHLKVECEDCHAKKRPKDSPGFYVGLKHESCANCHKDPHEGSLSTACVKCHANDGWKGRELKFNHNSDSEFALVSKHQDVSCTKCHKPPRPDAPLAAAQFKGIKRDCGSCHKEPHKEQFGNDCKRCHTPAGWKRPELRFDHGRDSKFQLAEKHSQVECEKCHKPPAGQALGFGVFKGLGSACADCHKEPHRRQFTAECSACHTPVGWAKASSAFDHNTRSKFQLLDKHAQVSCEKCHTPPSPEKRLGFAKFKDLKTACDACHKEPHNKQFADCAKCHSTARSFTVRDLKFNHSDDTKFMLAGKHQTTECAKCHKPAAESGKLASAQFKNLDQSCASCHKVKHPEQYGSACVSCHTPLRPFLKKPLGIEHISSYRSEGELLGGKHLAADCRGCHNEIRMGPLAESKAQYSCRDCHKANEPHKGTLGVNCTKCHSMTGWKGEDLKFNHQTMTSFVLDKDHKNLACAKCHVDNKWKIPNHSCKDCHPKYH